MNSGIYIIKNKINDKFYIGASIDVYRRKRQHFSELRRNNHANPHLQSSFNKHGQENFEWNILEFCEPLLCAKREQYYMDTLKPKYNILGKAEINFGKPKRILSEETKIKIRNALQGKIKSKEVGENISKAKRKNGVSNKTLLAISKPVINIKTGQIYKNLKEVCSIFNLTYQTTRDRLAGKTINDLDFRYLDNIYNQKIRKNFKTKAITVYSKNKKDVLFSFNSIQECKRELNKLGYKVDVGGIVKSCKNKIAYHKNMVFQYT